VGPRLIQHLLIGLGLLAGRLLSFWCNFQTISQLFCVTHTTYDKRSSSASPPAGHKLEPDTPIETTEQLRIAIDQGDAGDKVDASDPAAVPLGTDDEAGGTPNTTSQVREAAAHEVRPRPNSAGQRTTGLGHPYWFYLVRRHLHRRFSVFVDAVR
jgi:hypothetical protein